MDRETIILGLLLAEVIALAIMASAGITKEQKAIEAGLQQCKEGFTVVWKKEC